MRRRARKRDLRRERKGGNSLETPNVWVLSSFHPNVSKQLPPPQCLGFVLFSPRRFYREELAATWTPRQQLIGRGSHVAAMSAQGKTKKDAIAKSKEIAAGREDSGRERRREGAAARGSGRERERRREGAAARGSGGFRCLPLSAVDSIVGDFHGERENSVEIGGLGGPPFSNINNWKTSSMVSLPLRREVPTASLDFPLTT